MYAASKVTCTHCKQIVMMIVILRSFVSNLCNEIMTKTLTDDALIMMTMTL